MPPTKRQAHPWERSRRCVSSTFSSEASIASTIDLAIDSDVDQAAEAEQLYTPSYVASLREKRQALPLPAMNIFRILGMDSLGTLYLQMKN